MGLIKEPLDIDLYVDPRPLTEEDKKAISDFIKADKQKQAKRIARREKLKAIKRGGKKAVSKKG